jgi:DNA-binding NarL/FixJ family response regulator
MSSAMQKTAYRLVRSAIEKGALIRPDNCNRCSRSGTTSDGRSYIHAHHHDYTKPLDVEWICAACHRAETPLPENMFQPPALKGEENPAAKLTTSDVLKIRQMLSSGVSGRQIARMFSVDKRTIKRIKTRETWGWIAAAPDALETKP